MTTPPSISRRLMLSQGTAGVGMIGLAELFGQDAPAPLTAHSPHFAPRAKRIIHLLMNGGPSHIDTFDPKPELTRRHGQPLPTRNLRTERKTGAAMGSPFRFRPRGDSGLPVS